RIYLCRMSKWYIETGSQIETEISGARLTAHHGSVDAPRRIATAARPYEFHLAALRFLADDAQKNRRAVEEAVRGVQMRAAHGQIPRVDFHGDGQHAVARRRLPGVVVEFDQRHFAPAGACADTHHMQREIAHEIAAGNPHRQRVTLSFRIGTQFRDTNSIKPVLGQRRPSYITYTCC